jgi:hypothetical protein
MRLLSFCRTLLVALFGLYVAHVSAATIVLNDGTVIRGEIESLRNDVYTVSTEALGNVRVRKDQIRRIDYEDNPSVSEAPPAGEASGLPSFQSLQLQLMQSASVFSMIQALQSDPEIQAVMSDPEIASALAAGDFQSLLDNPKIQALAAHERIRAIIEAAQPQQ